MGAIKRWQPIERRLPLRAPGFPITLLVVPWRSAASPFTTKGSASPVRHRNRFRPSASQTPTDSTHRVEARPRPLNRNVGVVAKSRTNVRGIAVGLVGLTASRALTRANAGDSCQESGAQRHRLARPSGHRCRGHRVRERAPALGPFWPRFARMGSREAVVAQTHLR